MSGREVTRVERVTTLREANDVVRGGRQPVPREGQGEFVADGLAAHEAGSAVSDGVKAVGSGSPPA